MAFFSRSSSQPVPASAPASADFEPGPAEALVSMLEMYRLTGNARYYRAFAQTLDFIDNHQVAETGGWWATRMADGSPHENKSRTSMWQGGYHNGRALLQCAQRLEQLAGEGFQESGGSKP